MNPQHADANPGRENHLVSGPSNLEANGAVSVYLREHGGRENGSGPTVPTSIAARQTSFRATAADQRDRNGRVGGRGRRSEAPEPSIIPHCRYVVKTTSRWRCESCDEACGTDEEMYQCLDCTAQICRGCVEGKLDNEEQFGLAWDWNGPQHLAFKEAYLYRKRRAMGEFGEGGWTGAVQLPGLRGVTTVELRTQGCEPAAPGRPPVAISSVGGNGVNVNNFAPVTTVTWYTPVHPSQYPVNGGVFTVYSHNQRQPIPQFSTRPSLQDERNRVSRLAAMADTTAGSVPTAVNETNVPNMPHENNLRDRRRSIQDLALRALHRSEEDRQRAIEPQQDMDTASTDTSSDSQATIDDPDLSAEDIEILAGRDLTLRTYDTIPPPRSNQTPPPVGIFAVGRATELQNPGVVALGRRDVHTRSAVPTQAEHETTRRARMTASVPYTPSPRRPLPRYPPVPASSMGLPQTLPGAHATYAGYISTPTLDRQLHPRAILAVDPLTNQTYQIPIIQPPPVMTTYNMISPLYGGIVPTPPGAVVSRAAVLPAANEQKRSERGGGGSSRQ